MRTIFVFFLLVIYGSAYAQITITHSDYLNAWEPGSAYVNFATPLNEQVTVFIGEPSNAPQTWDFTGYTINQVGTSMGIEPGSAPLISEFPNANAVLYSKSYPTGDTIYAWQYQRIDADQLLLFGVSDETSVMLSYDPPVVQAVIPLTYNLTWQTQRDSIPIVPPYYSIITTTATVDAFGTLIIPAGTYECLRITLDRVGVTVTPLGNDTTRSRSYHFYTKDMVEVNIQGVTEDQFNQSTIDVMGFNFAVPDNSGFIRDDNQFTNPVYLYPNNPNPFQNLTTIRYQLSAPGAVLIKVFDFLGNDVKTLVNETQSAGRHDINFNSVGLPEGIYICQLKSGNRLFNTKMILTK